MNKRNVPPRKGARVRLCSHVCMQAGSVGPTLILARLVRLPVPPKEPFGAMGDGYEAPAAAAPHHARAGARARACVWASRGRGAEWRAGSSAAPRRGGKGGRCQRGHACSLARACAWPPRGERVVRRDGVPVRRGGPRARRRAHIAVDGRRHAPAVRRRPAAASAGHHSDGPRQCARAGAADAHHRPAQAGGGAGPEAVPRREGACAAAYACARERTRAPTHSHTHTHTRARRRLAC